MLEKQAHADAFFARSANKLDFGNWSEQEKMALSCRVLASEGHSETLAGQITVRQPDGTFLTTPMAHAFDEIVPGTVIRINEDMEVLEGRWRALGARSHGSIFQSWIWIGTWLRTLCPLRRARLVSVWREDECIGLGIVVEQRRLFALGLKHVRLHQVGERVADSITVEFNGVLSLAGREHDVLAACVAHFEHHERHWLTLYLPGLDMDGIPLERLRSPRLRCRW